MSSESAISAIETVRKKLEKYIDLKQYNKVDEYLGKLESTTVTPSLLQDTKIDAFLNRLALDSQAPYSSTARKVLKKWQEKNPSSSKSSDTSKVKTITNTNKAVTERKLAVKRKSDSDDASHSNRLSESQSSDDFQVDERGQQTQSSTKKRKVLTLSEYAGAKKTTPPPATTVDSAEEKFTDTQMKEIYAQFNANTVEKMAVNAPSLAKNVDKELNRTDPLLSNRNSFVASGVGSKATTVDPSQQQKKVKSFWDEEDEDEDDDNNDTTKPAVIRQPSTDKNKKTKNSTDLPVQQIKPSSMPKITTTKADPLILSAVASSIAPLEHSQAPTRPSLSKSTVVPKTATTNFNFLRPKYERQAVYSGKRATRTSIPSLQDLAIETLKENLNDACRHHFHRLPYTLLKPLIDSATPEQLYYIVDNNPDYVDDVEPLWQHFCSMDFKGAEREECETSYELYWRKFNEKEDRLQQITELAKRKKAETVDHARQTKRLLVTQSAFPRTSNSKTAVKSNQRQVVGLPPTKGHAGKTQVKKPAMAPLMKKTLRFFHGKS